MRERLEEKILESKTIVIKVGSARVSGDTKEINDFLYNLTGAIRKLRDKGKKIVIVSSGAIAQGKILYSTNYSSRSWDDISVNQKQALAAMGQNRLMNIYDSFFNHVNIPIAQILFGKNDILSKEGYINLTNTFATLLEWGILPIVNENDSIATEELNLGDNDLLSAMVASLINADLLTILTGVDGFIKDGKVIPHLTSIDESEFQYAHGPSGPGRGGMITKLKAGKILLNFGIITAIVNGNKKGNLDLLFSGNNPGTLIGSTEVKKNGSTFEEWTKRFFLE